MTLATTSGPAADAPEPQPVPEGYAIREPRDEDDLRATWTVNEDAFLEWSERERSTFEEWTATVSRRPGYEPWQLRPLQPKRPSRETTCRWKLGVSG